MKEIDKIKQAPNQGVERTGFRLTLTPDVRQQTMKIYRVTDAADLAQFSLAEINADIARCLWGYENGGTTQGRKAFFKRLVWLEKEREQLFDVPAKTRRFSPR